MYKNILSTECGRRIMVEVTEPQWLPLNHRNHIIKSMKPKGLSLAQPVVIPG